ncbi:hypothetical protein CYMTET_53506 [Cymbomonas tetramitiformis]|uniref:Uncharacterized protein n=1 Tax=Cymbomonas tetramitiformis TaxID=36881 RepID=A0AAE0ERN6_9CHLO|nr:hypothetical protein CYMTET_53506 [Cymbomonas tetramitiformis]
METQQEEEEELAAMAQQQEEAQEELHVLGDDIEWDVQPVALPEVKNVLENGDAAATVEDLWDLGCLGGRTRLRARHQPTTRYNKDEVLVFNGNFANDEKSLHQQAADERVMTGHPKKYSQAEFCYRLSQFVLTLFDWEIHFVLHHLRDSAPQVHAITPGPVRYQLSQTDALEARGLMESGLPGSKVHLIAAGHGEGLPITGGAHKEKYSVARSTPSATATKDSKIGGVYFQWNASKHKKTSSKELYAGQSGPPPPRQERLRLLSGFAIARWLTYEAQRYKELSQQVRKDDRGGILDFSDRGGEENEPSGCYLRLNCGERITIEAVICKGWAVGGD